MSDSFADLVALMARLRSPEGGCPWDREQTYETLAPMTLEEAYEMFDAVEDAAAGRPEALRDELGDLLFHIVFYSQIAGERGEFTIDDVARAVHAKMVRRHPHVFGEREARDADEVSRNWEEIKAEEKRAERAGRGDSDAPPAYLLDKVPTKRPALTEAHQLSARSAAVGFDWPGLEDVLTKLQEEVEELRAAVKARAADEVVRGEVGDLLFAAINVARLLKIDPEAALKTTNRKFRRRFEFVERILRERGRQLNEASLEELETLWQQAKWERAEAN